MNPSWTSMPTITSTSSVPISFVHNWHCMTFSNFLSNCVIVQTGQQIRHFWFKAKTDFLIFFQQHIFIHEVKVEVMVFTNESFLPKDADFQWALCCVSVFFILWNQATSNVCLLCPSLSTWDSSVSVTPAKLWLFFLVEVDAVLTSIPFPRSPSTISSSRLLSSRLLCICTWVNFVSSSMYLTLFRFTPRWLSHFSS